ncbi:hypothetical protein DMENIID0001_167220 [Sergentomyia squamirostris]
MGISFSLKVSLFLKKIVFFLVQLPRRGAPSWSGNQQQRATESIINSTLCESPHVGQEDLTWATQKLTFNLQERLSFTRFFVGTVLIKFTGAAESDAVLVTSYLSFHHIYRQHTQLPSESSHSIERHINKFYQKPPRLLLFLPLGGILCADLNT